MRLIDAGALLRHLEKDPLFPLVELEYNVSAVIESAPTVDAVEVVRCKDCKHYEKYPKWSACTYWSGDPYEQAWVEDNDFCSYGERRSDD